MTNTRHTVYRQTEHDYSVLYPKAKKIVVGITEGDVLEFREGGGRVKWLLPIPDAFRIAVKRGAKK